MLGKQMANPSGRPSRRAGRRESAPGRPWPFFGGGGGDRGSSGPLLGHGQWATQQAASTCPSPFKLPPHLRDWGRPGCRVAVDGPERMKNFESGTGRRQGC